MNVRWHFLNHQMGSFEMRMMQLVTMIVIYRILHTTMKCPAFDRFLEVLFSMEYPEPHESVKKPVRVCWCLRHSIENLIVMLIQYLLQPWFNCFWCWQWRFCVFFLDKLFIYSRFFSIDFNVIHRCYQPICNAIAQQTQWWNPICPLTKLTYTSTYKYLYRSACK